MAGGLEGVVAAQTSLSWIDGQRGMLVYRGYAIDDLARHATFEEICHLLLEGTLPTEAELEATRKRLGQNAELDDNVLQVLRILPPDTVPMEALRTGVSALPAGEGVPTYDADDLASSRDHAYRIIAKIPSLIGAFHRMRSGDEPITPDPSASVASNLLHGLLGTQPDEDAVAAMDCALVLHAEHTLNASTFAARITAATLSDIYSAIVSAIGTLRGPLHGGANEKVAELLDSIDSVDAVEQVIDDKLSRKERIMGFGHRVYKTEDPRGPHLRDWAEKLATTAGREELFLKAKRVQEVVFDRKGLYINVDFYSAPLYTAMGIPRDLFTPLFAASRAAGWTAHVLEQQGNNRLIRPTSEYIGERQQNWMPLPQRG
ncbi:MAG: citrate synthase [Actinobacteria bacterium]|nr:citrate synthase [Actinomycetota bacterium]